MLGVLWEAPGAADSKEYMDRSLKAKTADAKRVVTELVSEGHTVDNFTQKLVCACVHRRGVGTAVMDREGEARGEEMLAAVREAHELEVNTAAELTLLATLQTTARPPAAARSEESEGKRKAGRI